MIKYINKIKTYVVAIVLVLIDQIIKFIVVNNAHKMPLKILDGFLKFTYCENRGVAFSLGEGNVALFIVLNILLISLLIFYYEKKKENFNKLGSFFVSITMAGGISNLIDRVTRGFVVDFIDVNEIINFAIFNVADIFITVGVIGLAIYYIISENKK